jgi:hypothetical protein
MIMQRHPGRLTSADWQQIAIDHGRRFTARQLKERWNNFVRPPLDRSEFTIAERRQAMRLSVTSYGRWKDIASQIGNGVSRSPAMVKHVVWHLAPKLEAKGFCVSRPEDVDLLPDELFEWGFPKGEVAQALVAEFRAKKTALNAPAKPAVSLSQQFSISALMCEDLKR